MDLIPDNRLKPKFALLSTSAYLQLNEAISKAKGYDLSDATARYSNVVPNLAKVNIRYVNKVETFDTIAVMEITAEVQEKYPELTVGLNLVDSYIPNGTSTEMIAVDLSSVTVDYTLNHLDAIGTTLEVVQLESSPRTVESDVSVAHLVSEGCTIITVL